MVIVELSCPVLSLMILGIVCVCVWGGGGGGGGGGEQRKDRRACSGRCVVAGQVSSLLLKMAAKCDLW